jgi:hypothetical protein
MDDNCGLPTIPSQEQLDAECGKILSDAIWQMMVALNRAKAEEIRNAR